MNDYVYTIFSNGSKTGLEVMDPEEGYENRVIAQRKTKSLSILIRSIFKDQIFGLSFSQITVENSLEKLFEMSKKYILPDDTLVKKGKRRHPFRVSARPKGLCATLLWKEVLAHKIPITMAGFSRKISVPRTTIIGAFKQLDDYSVLNVSKPGKPILRQLRSKAIRKV